MTKLSMLDIAITLESEGYAVFPLVPGDKIPLISTEKGGHGCLDATRDVRQIRKWWTDNPKANIGIATGIKSNLFVVDLDMKDGLDGVEAWKELGGTLDTKTVMTPSGGLHLYFRYPENQYVSISASELAPGVDTRGEGGYVVAPGSVLENGEYLWEGSEDAPILPLPAWVVFRLREAKARAKTNSDDLPRDFHEGSRNAMLTSLAGTLRKRGCSDTALLAFLLEENQARCSPPLADAEVEQIAKSVGRYDEIGAGVRETDLETTIQGYDRAGSASSKAAQLREIVALINTRDAFEQTTAWKSVSEQTGVSVPELKRLAKGAAKQAAGAETRGVQDTVYDKVLSSLSRHILIPKDEGGWANPNLALFLIHAEGFDYVVPLWEDRDAGALSKRVQRQIRQTIQREAGEDAAQILRGLHDGESEFVKIRSDIELAIDEGRLGRPVTIATGPSLIDGKFHAQTDEAGDVFILREYRADNKAMLVVRDGVKAEENVPTWERLRTFWGEHSLLLGAHAVSAIAHLPETRTRKHILALLGPPETGKSVVAFSLQTLIDGSACTLSAKNLHKQWAKFLQFRCPVLDNLDKSSLSDDSIDDFTTLLTSPSVNLEVRYSVSGLTGEGGYPILTSVRQDLLNYNEALKSRAVIILQNPRPDLQGKGHEGESLAKAARGHVWWFTERFIADCQAGLVPDYPGGVRQVAFARAYWWMLVNVGNFSAEQANALCSDLRPSEDSEEGSPFKKAVTQAISGADRDGTPITGLSTRALWDIVRNYSTPLLEEARFKMDGQPWQRLSNLIQKIFVGGRVGDYLLLRRVDSHTKRAVLDFVPVAAGAIQPAAPETPRDTGRAAGAAGAAGYSGFPRADEKISLFPEGETISENFSRTSENAAKPAAPAANRPEPWGDAGKQVTKNQSQPAANPPQPAPTIPTAEALAAYERALLERGRE